MKHIELDLYFVKEKVQSNQVSISYISAKDQVADILTKPLSKASFLHFREWLSTSANEFPYVLAMACVGRSLLFIVHSQN